jgi:hypothetical protein
MEWLDEKWTEPGGGKVASGGGFYHLSFRSLSSGNCARATASYEYIAREGEYAGDEESMSRCSPTSRRLASLSPFGLRP